MAVTMAKWFIVVHECQSVTAMQQITQWKHQWNKLTDDTKQANQ